MTDYQQHPEYLVLLRGILENPADDAPRGILADWIQDHGDDARAEFIRGQLASPASVVEWQCTSAGDWVSSGPVDPGVDSMVRDLIVSGLLDGWRPDGKVVLQRGFVAAVGLPAVRFLTAAGRLFASHPLTQIELADCVPCIDFSRPHAYWFPRRSRSARVLERSHDAIPDAIFDLIRGLRVTNYTGEVMASDNRFARFPSALLANRALSEACVAYGRTRAGLPPLP